jgi:hypothetical protein
MSEAKKYRSVLLCLAAVVALAVGSSAQKRSVSVTDGDVDAGNAVTSVTHVFAVKNSHGDAFKGTQKLRSLVSPGGGAGLGPSQRYPGDLQFHGGAVLDSTVSHAIYLQPNGVACPIANCWGNPEGFLKDIGDSLFIHVVDNFVGLYSTNRYTVGDAAVVNVPPPTLKTNRPTAYTDSQMLQVIHAVAKAFGETGYGHMYHVFLPPGTDECQDSARNSCYSPDSPDQWVFCAYHGSVTFGDIGKVVYSIEPYQNVGGCAVKAGTPNGALADSTNSVLSHELIEAITDPDLDAWWNSANNGVFGEEIADECSFLAFDNQGNFLGFDPSLWQSDNGHKYATQPEYSNVYHSCVALPFFR